MSRQNLIEALVSNHQDDANKTTVNFGVTKDAHTKI